jgi:hypothetical protein
MQEVHEPSLRRILEGQGEPVCHDALIPTSGLDNDDVELEELDGVGRSVIASTYVRPELVRLDHVALLMSERKAPRVVDELAGDLDVLTSLTDVINGTVVILLVVLKTDVCVFWSALYDVAAWLATWRQRCTRSRPLGQSRFGVARPQGARPRRWVWSSHTLGNPKGRVFVCDGDEFGDSSKPPLAAALGGMVAQQLLRHGESLYRG